MNKLKKTIFIIILLTITSCSNPTVTESSTTTTKCDDNGENCTTDKNKSKKVGENFSLGKTAILIAIIAAYVKSEENKK